MYLIGSNNSKFVDNEYIKKYLEQNHRPNSVYGLSKGDYFWMMDMTFRNQEEAARYIKLYESRGFKVYHNITIIEEIEKEIAAEASVAKVTEEEAVTETIAEEQNLPETEDVKEEVIQEVKPAEEKKPKQRKRTGGSKRKE